MSHQNQEEEQKNGDGKTEMYTPKMKPGDVEIPNRIFVKGVSKDTVEEDLIFRFEEFGKVVDCRIVLDRFGNSKGYGFITFDSQNIAEKVREMGRVKFNDDIELVIGPARIKKKRFYLLPGNNVFNSAQPCYLQDGNLIFPANMQPQQVIQPAHMVSNVQMTPVIQQQQMQAQQPAQQQQQQQQTPPPQQQQFHPQQQQYTGPVIYSVVNEQSLPINVHHPHPTYVAYQASQPLTTIMEKVDRMNISQVSTPVRSHDDQEVPNFSSQHINIDHYGGPYHRLRSGTF